MRLRARAAAAPREERRSPAGICAIIALLVLLVIGALVALWVLFFSGDDEDEPVDDQAQEQPEQQDEEQELSPEDGQEDSDASQTVTPQEVSFDEEDGIITIPDVEGIQYLVEGQPVSDEVGVEPGETVTVNAEAMDGYEFSEGATTEWQFTAEEVDEERPAPANAASGSSFTSPAAASTASSAAMTSPAPSTSTTSAPPCVCDDGSTFTVSSSGSSEPDCDSSVGGQ
ncbi:hypothetical protein [Nesterenkonia pannonica]|uniref:hypothetical protein n=1 Tax=Nesterenkonia pannonica TaxID=1548602 RepID=UPI002164AD21|nr:hypothetical protein [Nesterenkonia pannonica]